VGAAFDVYGYRFRVRTKAATPAAEGLASDFSFFRRESLEGPLEIELCLEDPPYDDVPPRAASGYRPRSVSFTEEPRTFVDYGGRALAVYDRAAHTLRIHSREPDMLYEAACLFLLSRIGEFLDTAGLHRIHAMALAYRGRAVLAILPMGGGKESTLTAGCSSFRISISCRTTHRSSPRTARYGHFLYGSDFCRAAKARFRPNTGARSTGWSSVRKYW